MSEKNNFDNENIQNQILEDNNDESSISKVEDLTSQMAILEEKIKENEDKYLRSLAEFENSKKRFEKMQQDTSKYAIVNFAREIIAVLDIFDKALMGINRDEIQDKTFSNFLFGIELTKKELSKTMEKFHIKTIDSLGKKFDANFHESLFSKEDSSKEDGTIIEVLEEGYMIYDRLLRPAKVGIIKNNS